MKPQDKHHGYGRMDERPIRVEFEISWKQLWLVKEAAEILGIFDKIKTSVLDDAYEPFEVMIEFDDPGWKFRDPELTVPGCYPCKFINSTGKNIRMRFFTDLDNTLPQPATNESGAIEVQPVQINIDGSKILRFNVENYVAIWIKMEMEEPTGWVERGSSGGGPDMGINDP